MLICHRIAGALVIAVLALAAADMVSDAHAQQAPVVTTGPPSVRLYMGGNPPWEVYGTGVVNTRGQAGTAWFEIGGFTPRPIELAATDADQPVENFLVNPFSNATGETRLVAEIGGDRYEGAWMSYRTGPVPLLRPPYRVRIVLPRAPARTTEVGAVSIIGAPPDARASVSVCRSGTACRTIATRVVRRRAQVLLRARAFEAGDVLRVFVEHPSLYSNGSPALGTILSGLTSFRFQRNRFPSRSETCRRLQSDGPRRSPCAAVRATIRGSLVKRLQVIGVPEGHRVDVRCSGPGCPRAGRTIVRRTPFILRRETTTVAFPQYSGRQLSPRTRLEVLVTTGQSHGLYFRVPLNGGGANQTYRCVLTPHERARRCPRR